MDSNTFKLFLTDLDMGDGHTYKYFDVSKLHADKYDRLPYSIRVLLESVVRNCDEFHVTSKDVKNILNWPETQHNEVEIPFLPSRVLLQDFTGVPAIVDFAAMRDAVQSLGGDPSDINPKCPADLVIDHSIQVDVARRLIVTLPSTTTSTTQQQNSHHKTTGSSSVSKPGSRQQQQQLGGRSCCLSNESNSSSNGTRSPSASSSSIKPSNFRNQADLLYQSMLANTSVNKNNTLLQSSNNNSNQQQQQHSESSRQTVIDAVYENCPFHNQRTECADALEKNQALEFERNQERFQFLKWGARAFKNMKIVPPGSGIVHQVNLECLARVAFNDNGLLYPDSLVGTDSHTTMINGLGIVGWGVGGIEAEAVMLGQPISMVLPEVVGYRITGKLSDLCTSTDVVLTITKHLRQIGVVNKFVEFFGSGVAQLSIADRATIANMCPEYGATIGFFPPDAKAIQYLTQTGRDASTVVYIEKYLRAVKLFRDYTEEEATVSQPAFSHIFELDLASVQPCVSGPKRPQDKVFVSDLKKEFASCLSNKVGPNGFGLKEEATSKKVKFVYEDGIEYEIGHGSVVIAAITSCTNTSNPSVMLAAGLLAKKATDLGLRVRPYVKTSLSPGSGVVTEYLNKSGMLPCLEQLGFNVVGYGCMTCIGNSGPLHESIVETIEKNDLVAVGVLSGNRNFEGRIHPSTRANYLASPPLVVAYALAGRIDIDFENEPLGFSTVQNKHVYLRDVWPTRRELQELETNYVIPEMFSMVYEKLTLGNKQWNTLKAPETDLYPWDVKSTYIKRPPFFDGMTPTLDAIKPIVKSRVLLHLGDSITTDHISPAGSIARNSPAAKYLSEMGLAPRDFNSYGSRRGNDAVMSRGTFANIRLVNRLVEQVGARTLFLPTNQTMDIFDAAESYKRLGVPVIILAGKEYGSGSSRDWAAKGPWMLGVRAVIAESYERIHRSNLIGMGVIPFQYMPGESSETLGLTGREVFDIHVDQELSVKKVVDVETDTGVKFQVLARIDTQVELNYVRHGGVLNYMVRKFLK